MMSQVCFSFLGIQVRLHGRCHGYFLDHRSFTSTSYGTSPRSFVSCTGDHEGQGRCQILYSGVH